MKTNLLYKIIIYTGITLGITLGAISAAYLKILPQAVSNPKVINFVQETAKKYANADLIIENPVLHTEFSPDINFKVKKIHLSKENKKLFELNNFETSLSFRKILFKTLIIKKLVAENIFADVNELEKLIPAKETKIEQKNDWKADVFDALLGVNDCKIIYAISPDTVIKLHGRHIGVNNAEKIKKNVYFKLNADIIKKDKKVTLKIKDNNRVYFQDNLFHVEDCPLGINNSNIYINLTADRKRDFDINLFSKSFNINDILDFLKTQIVENNIQDTLAYFNDIYGNLDFKLNIKKDNINGNFKINKIGFKVKDVNNIPITITKGNVDLTSTDIALKGFEGYYDNSVNNKIDFEGTVKDYLNSIDTNLTGNALVKNDFLKKHLSKMTGTDFEIKGEAPTRIVLKSKNNIMDFTWYFMLKPEQNIKIANDYLPFEDTLRLMKSEMHLENMILDIKSLDYHMIPKEKLPPKGTPRQKRPQGNKPQPIFRLKSSINLAKNGYINYVGFEIPKPLPSELLNAIMHQEMFKKGTISGNLFMDNRGKTPVFDGKLSMEKVIVPSLRMFVKEASLDAKNDLIHLNTIGGFRRSKFSFNGKLLNSIKFPIIVKDVNLSLENIDLYKMFEDFNNGSDLDNTISTDYGTVNVSNTNDEFDIRNLIIEKGSFHLDNGSYKDIVFGNLDADLTLNKDGVIYIKSNRFNFAEGISSLRSTFDLVNKKYNVKLGILNVNSDIIARALLNLEREITGKAGGFLDITTDDSMKLSGKIDFKIVDGQIEKIGLVEYVLKCASLLRNTVTMISPATFADIVNVPEGQFDKITGKLTLRNNVATAINIKTYSPQLSNYIAGRYNIENGDTSLRVYTKFSGKNKGVSGFLRKISLSSLANRIPLNSRNDINYYAVELAELPEIDADEKDCQIYLTRVEGDVANNNYISSLKKLK